MVRFALVVEQSSRSILPDFYIIGAQKAATTSMYEWLSRQKNCNLPRIKEPHYFSDDQRFSRGLKWYLSLFDAHGGPLVRGDVDPDYLCSPEAPGRISSLHRDTVPRFVVLLRNPYDRARSHWQMSSRKSLESREIHEAISESFSNWPNNDPEIDYFGNGYYAVALERYIEKFGKENILPVIYEELVSPEYTGQIFNEICQFIGLKEVSEVPSNTQRHNIIGKPRSKMLMKMIYSEDNPIRKIVGRLIPGEELKARAARFFVRANSSSKRENLNLNPHLLPEPLIESYSEMTESLVSYWPHLAEISVKWTLER